MVLEFKAIWSIVFLFPVFLYSMLSFIVIFLFVLANLALGCQVSIMLGYGPPDWKTALGLLVDPNRLTGLYHSLLSRIPFLSRWAKPVQAEVASVSESDEDSVVAETDEPEPTFEEVLNKLAQAEAGDLLYDESDDISDLMPMQEIFDDDLASALEEQGTEVWLVNEKHVETSLLKLNVVMMKSGRFAAELDTRIRKAEGAIVIGDIRRFRDELKDDCQNYLDAQAAITEQMQKRIDEFGELKSLAEDVDFANMEQSSQIETTLANLGNMDMGKEPTLLANDLKKELANLRIARHRLRDMQDRTFMEIVFYEDRVDTIPQQLCYDEIFGIRGRIGIDVAVYEWWKQKRHQKRQITFALLDFARFSEANFEHGISICNKVVKKIGEDLNDRFDTADLVGLYYGNCYLVATVNAGPKKTITEIERIRQHYEKMTFSYNNGADAMQVQFTCAITEALATQSREEVMKALESTMAAAKKAGRNHTYHFVPGPLNKPPELVDAPNLGEIEKVIDLDEIPTP